MVEVTSERRRKRPTSGAAVHPRPRATLLYCPTTCAEEGGLKLLRVPLASRGEALVVFSSREAAQSSFPSKAFPVGCDMRVCSGGELVSLLFGPYKDVGWVLLDPLPGQSPERGATMPNLIRRKRFVDHLLGHSALTSAG